MQINGVGNNQIGNSYQNPNRMPNSTTGKKEDEDINKRLEAMGVKVELSFQQAGPQEQEMPKESVETQNSQEAFSVIGWIRKIWDAGIAWLKSIWNDEQPEKNEGIDLTSRETAGGEADVMLTETPGEGAGEMFETDVELVAETPIDEDADYAAMYAKTTDVGQGIVAVTNLAGSGHFDFRVSDEEMQMDNKDKYRTVGTPLHTSGMQDSYNRYGRHSKLGVEPANNMTIRK